MKWTRRNGDWYNERDEKGTPVGLPYQFSRGGRSRAWQDYDFFDDGVQSQVDPVGYSSKSSYSGTVWLKDTRGLIPEGSVALEHLIEGALDPNHKNWHLSSNISGADSTTYYLHPGKNDGTLYLLDQSRGSSVTMHSDGIPMIEVISQGKVSDGKHKF